MKRISFNEGWEYAMQSDGFLGTVTEEFRPVTLPHDAMICRPRNRDAAGKNNSGYYPEGVYEYRKRFTVPEEWKEKRIIIEFEAAYMQAMDGFMEVFPIATTNDRYMVDGVLTSVIPAERGELFQSFQYLQHYWRREFLYGDLLSQTP